METTGRKTRILRNTLMLYFRMILLMLVSLYTSRVILGALGVEDFGTYNVVGGLVSLFSVLSGSLSNAITRYLSFEVGSGDEERLKKVFSASVWIQVILSVLVVLLAETVGMWYIRDILVVSPGRLSAAIWCFQCSLAAFVTNLLSIPYRSAITAHERMDAFANISILEAILALGIAFMVSHSTEDRLRLYAGLMLLSALAIRLVWVLFCRTAFGEVRCRRRLDKAVLKEMTRFAGWNFFGTAAFFLRFYGGNLLLNFFFGPAVNAAKGISSSVSSAISRFRDNFITALNPQINKSYAQQDREFFFSLVFSGCRLSLFLMLLLTAPLLLSTSFILELWLGNVPGYAVVFTQLVLGYEIIEGITCPLITAMLATGDIKRYELAVGACELLYLPLTWLLLRYGSDPEIVLVMSIIISLLILAVRLMFLRMKTGLNIRGFLREVIWRAILVTLAGLTLPLVLSFLISEGWSSFLTLTLLSLVTMGASIFFIGCDKKEQAFLRDKCGRLLRMKR